MNRFFLTALCALSIGSASAQSTSGADYTKGVFIVNEDWYGHNNSTINFLTDDYEWYYRVFQTENPGKELGCTSQYGTIYGNRMYIVSKQDKDPGSNITGGRFNVCDATTMKLIKSFQYIAQDEEGNSIADGRAYLPVDEHKGYISSSNGIWLFDSDNLTIGSQIKGTGNPNSDGYGAQYLAQTGTMVRANDKVFAIHQQQGILVIDAKADTITDVIKAPTDIINEKEIQRGFGSIIMSKDGTLWASVAKDVNGSGDAAPYIYHINPYTLETEKIDIPEGIGLVPNSWYAWTADGFCASAKENKIYWKELAPGGSWFASNKISGYDIDNNEFFKVIDLTEKEGGWNLYGTGFRISPANDKIYAFLFHDFQDQTNVLAIMNNKGEIEKENSMTANYWFPALPVFPDNEEPVVSEEFPTEIELSKDEPEFRIHLTPMVSDADNMDAAIVKEVSNVVPEDSPIKAEIHNDSLIVSCNTPTNDNEEAEIEIKFNSNGRIITRNINVTCNNGDTGIGSVVGSDKLSVYPNPASSYISINIEGTADVKFYTVNGTLVKHVSVNGNERIDISSLTGGIYLLHVKTEGKEEVLKLLKL